jgi:hypothetical protein
MDTTTQNKIEAANYNFDLLLSASSFSFFNSSYCSLEDIIHSFFLKYQNKSNAIATIKISTIIKPVEKLREKLMDKD